MGSLSHGRNNFLKGRFYLRWKFINRIIKQNIIVVYKPNNTKQVNLSIFTFLVETTLNEDEINQLKENIQEIISYYIKIAKYD